MNRKLRCGADYFLATTPTRVSSQNAESQPKAKKKKKRKKPKEDSGVGESTLDDTADFNGTADSTILEAESPTKKKKSKKDAPNLGESDSGKKKKRKSVDFVNGDSPAATPSKKKKKKKLQDV